MVRFLRFPLRFPLGVTILIALLLLSGWGCRRPHTADSDPRGQGSNDAAPLSARPARAPHAAGAPTVEHPGEGEETWAPSSPLEEFPSDMPIYPGAVALASHRTIAHLAVTFATSDGLPHVLAFYRERLPQEQWVVHEQKAGEGEPILEGRKGSRTCRVEVTEDHARTYITVTLVLDSEIRQRE